MNLCFYILQFRYYYMPPTFLIVPLLVTLLHAFFYAQRRKQLPEMRKFAANVMELAKNIYEDQEEYENSITKGENSFNRYYHYTKCSYLFSFHPQQQQKTTPQQPISQTPTNCHFFFVLFFF